MRILFASSDRDLLESCSKLLGSDTGETVTAFDGTQALLYLADGRFDAAVIDRKPARIDHKMLLKRLKEKNVPILALVDGPVNVRRLTEEELPSAMLSFPFGAEDLERTLCETVDIARNGKSFDFHGITVDASDFRIAGGPELVAGEIVLLKELLSGAVPAADRGVYVGSLNCKFAAVGSKVRIRYSAKKGFNAVTQDEEG